jgi:hypothetical protein
VSTDEDEDERAHENGWCYPDANIESKEVREKRGERDGGMEGGRGGGMDGGRGREGGTTRRGKREKKERESERARERDRWVERERTWTPGPHAVATTR